MCYLSRDRNSISAPAKRYILRCHCGEMQIFVWPITLANVAGSINHGAGIKVAVQFSSPPCLRLQPQMDWLSWAIWKVALIGVCFYCRTEYTIGVTNSLGRKSSLNSCIWNSTRKIQNPLYADILGNATVMNTHAEHQQESPWEVDKNRRGEIKAEKRNFAGSCVRLLSVACGEGAQGRVGRT